VSRKGRQRAQRRYVRVITEAEAGFPHAVAMREGARKILADYENPPEGGTLVPRAWVEENRAALDVAAEADAEVERQIIGDVSNWKPEGLAAYFEAMTRPAPGYTEIANEGGIRWHTRTDAL
jgi:hypothetical protein